MLLENFYKIIHRKEREDGKREIEIELNPGHALYQGHFPGQPVVPGVCTLQMIKESAEQIVSQPLQYVQIASSKFLSAISTKRNFSPFLGLFNSTFFPNSLDNHSSITSLSSNSSRSIILLGILGLSI